MEKEGRDLPEDIKEAQTNDEKITPLGRPETNAEKDDNDNDEDLELDSDSFDIPDEIWSDYVTEEYAFYKDNVTDKCWHVERKEQVVGPLEFTFDFKKIYNLWTDYPWKMSEKEVEIFNEEQPFWRDFFSYRFDEKDGKG